jgi:hypothetical protein
MSMMVNMDMYIDTDMDMNTDKDMDTDACSKYSEVNENIFNEIFLL